MKKLFYCLLISAVAMTATAAKKKTAQTQGLFANDTEVKVGTLPNGLTYYIRHNEEPKERAYFYIAQKVGAIQEEPQQRGLAHFLEHMAFNGTTNFPGQELRTWLQNIGVKFGADLNAYTSVDQTVYNIDNVPTTRESIVDSCLMILHDWSHDLLLEDQEIDNERGVIQEEWRMRNSAQQRMAEQMMPVLHAGSKYADAMPIGSMDIVMHFPYKDLRDYYAKWYRPDLQGIIVVGDIDVNQVEAKIKRMFSDIPKPGKNAAKREYYTQPDNEQPIVFIGSDKELTAPALQYFFKHEATPRDQRNTREAMLSGLYNSFMSGMFAGRIRDIAMKPNAPFTAAYIQDGNFYLAQTKDALTGSVGCKNANGAIEKGATAFLRELFRVRRYGFTQTEFDRSRQDFLTQLDRLLKDKDKRQSKQFVNEYVNSFLDNEPIPSLDDEAAFWKAELPKQTVDDLNRYFRSLFPKDEKNPESMSATRNLCIVLTAPKNDTLKLPTQQELLALYDRVSKEQLTPYVDEVTQLPFLPAEPTPGKIVSETADSEGTVTMELSNGMKVVVMKTEHKKDEILMASIARGGSSLYPAEVYKYVSMANMAVAQQGLGNYNVADMNKKFTGNTAGVNASIDQQSQSIAGSCSPKDLKTLLEKTYASFRYPHKDQEAYESLVERLKRGVKDREGQPNKVYADSLRKTIYGDNPYAHSMTIEDYEQADNDQLINLYKERFADASNFTTMFVGNVDLDSLRPLVERYLASLPSTYKHETAQPVLDYMPGSRTCMFDKEQETPKSTITMLYHAPGQFSRRNQLVSSILGQVLTIIYTKTIREEAGAAYSVGASASVAKYPKEEFEITVQFPTDPKTRDLAISLVDKGIDDLIKDGVAQEDIDKVKEYMIKVNRSSRTQNAYWLNMLMYKWEHGTDISKGYEEMVNGITVKDIQDMARTIKAGDRLTVVMSTPASQNEKAEK